MNWSPDPGRLARPVKQVGRSAGPGDSFTGRASRPGSVSSGGRPELAGDLVHRPDEPAGVHSPTTGTTPVVLGTLRR